jgi:hypothetical protein
MPLHLTQRNPITTVGTLDPCWLFVYRTSVEDALAVLPRGLAPVTHHGFAFWNVVVCRVSDMRPRGAISGLGVSFWQVSYRIYVRAHIVGDPSTIDGIYFVRSDCDNALIRLGGNRITDFAFHRAHIAVDERGDNVYLRVRSDAPASVHLVRSGAPSLAQGSPFATIEEAAGLLQYKPFGISVDERGRFANVVAITRDEARWRTRLVQVPSANWSFFAGRPAQLELCYEAAPILYRWNRGVDYRLREEPAENSQSGTPNG